MRRNVGSIGGGVVPEDKKTLPGSESNKNIRTGQSDQSGTPAARKGPGQTISSPQSGSNAGDEPTTIDVDSKAGPTDDFWEEGGGGGSNDPLGAAEGSKDIEEGGGTTKCDD